jgi:hypothetical protein
MLRFYTLLICIALITGCSSHMGSCLSPDTKGLAPVLMAKERFALFLKGVVERTYTFAGMTAEEKARLPEAYATVIERHAVTWEKNMLDSWAKLSATDLKKVCDAVNNGDQRTFVVFAKHVGPDVKKTNEPLLRQAAKEVLDAI